MRITINEPEINFIPRAYEIQNKCTIPSWVVRSAICSYCNKAIYKEDIIAVHAINKSGMKQLFYLRLQ